MRLLVPSLETKAKPKEPTTSETTVGLFEIYIGVPSLIPRRSEIEHLGMRLGSIHVAVTSSNDPGEQ